jgi:porin
VGPNAPHGTDFAAHSGDGVLSLGEIGWITTSVTGGRPGRLAAGGWYDSSTYTRLERRSQQQHGNGGWWVLGEQLVYRESPAGTQGLTPFVNVAGADDAVSPMPIFVAFGLVYKGLVRDRTDDTTVLGLAWGAFSDDLARRQRRNLARGGRRRGPQDDEIVLELGHRFVLAPWFPWLSVQPDAQYIVDPSGTGDIPDALALGVQINVLF